MSTTASVSHSNGLNALLTLALLAALAGCGPASSGNAPNLEPGASVAGPGNRSEASGTGRAARTLPTVASSPAPLAPRLSPGNQGEARPEQPLGMPAWMAKDLDSPEVPGRLRALETWAQQPRTGAIDPLLLAVDDPDERVRAKAFALLDDDWARELAAEEQAGSAGR